MEYKINSFIAVYSLKENLRTSWILAHASYSSITNLSTYFRKIVQRIELYKRIVLFTFPSHPSSPLLPHYHEEILIF